MPKLILGVMIGLLVALGAGWFWGASGRWGSERALRAAELRSDLVGAQAAALAARVDLYNVNFGDASGHLEDAKGLLAHASEQLKSSGKDAERAKLEPAAVRLGEAQQMAGRLDAAANARAAEAVRIMTEVATEVTAAAAR
jgi:hypothetical protein